MDENTPMSQGPVPEDMLIFKHENAPEGLESPVFQLLAKIPNTPVVLSRGVSTLTFTGVFPNPDTPKGTIAQIIVGAQWNLGDLAGVSVEEKEWHSNSPGDSAAWSSERGFDWFIVAVVKREGKYSLSAASVEVPLSSETAQKIEKMLQRKQDEIISELPQPSTSRGPSEGENHDSGPQPPKGPRSNGHPGGPTL